ncbi:hypothetical protein ACFE04_003139 [Oxalis oulophora]
MDMQESKRGVRVIMFPLPLQGHINPMLQLASILYSKGFSITIVHTKFNSPNPTNFPHFTFHSIPDGLLEGSDRDPIALLKLINLQCVNPLQNLLPELMLEYSKMDRVACLITDANLHFTQALADEIKLPRLVLRTSNVSSFFGFVALPILKKKNYLPIKESQLEVPVIEFPPLRVKDLPDIKTANPEDLHIHMGFVVDKIKASSGLIWNSFEELEHDALITCRREFSVPVFPIGPFHKVGVHLEYKLERKHIEESIRKLMADVRIRERSLKLKEKVEQCLRPGGSSFQALDSLVNCISLL